MGERREEGGREDGETKLEKQKKHFELVFSFRFLLRSTRFSPSSLLLPLLFFLPYIFLLFVSEKPNTEMAADLH